MYVRLMRTHSLEFRTTVGDRKGIISRIQPLDGRCVGDISPKPTFLPAEFHITAKRCGEVFRKSCFVSVKQVSFCKDRTKLFFFLKYYFLNYSPDWRLWSISCQISRRKPELTPRCKKVEECRRCF